MGTVAEGRLLPSPSDIIRMLLTFFLVVFGWIIFRSENLGQAFSILGQIFSASLFSFANPHGKVTFLFVFFLLGVEWIQRDKQHALQFDGKVKSPLLRWSIYYFLVLVILCCKSDQSAFIYFQF